MDAMALSKASLPSRLAAEDRARSGRTLAEMAVHIFSWNETSDIFRLDVTCGRIDRSRKEPAKWAKDWRLCKTDDRSGTTGECAHVFDAFLLYGPVGGSGAKEARCDANI